MVAVHAFGARVVHFGGSPRKENTHPMDDKEQYSFCKILDKTTKCRLEGDKLHGRGGGAIIRLFLSSSPSSRSLWDENALGKKDISISIDEYIPQKPSPLVFQSLDQRLDGDGAAVFVVVHREMVRSEFKMDQSNGGASLTGASSLDRKPLSRPRGYKSV